MGELVSVIIPVYNGEKYLNECIKSICKQTYKNIEVIIIDDGSTDDTHNICDSWAAKDSRIIVIHKNNEGVSAARNDGIKRSTGKYLYFCDSDDLVNKNCIEVLHRAITNSNADMALCTYADISEYNREPIEKLTSSTVDGDNILLLIMSDKRYAGYLWNKMFRRDMINGIRFDTRLKYCEDLVFCLKYLEKVNYGVMVSESLYYYRDNPSGAMNQSFNVNRLSYILSQEFVCDYLLKHCTNEEIKKTEHYRLAQLYSSYYFKIFVRQIPDKSYWRETIKKGFSQRAHKYGCNPKWSVITKIRYYILALLFSTNTK